MENYVEFVFQGAISFPVSICIYQRTILLPAYPTSLHLGPSDIVLNLDTSSLSEI